MLSDKGRYERKWGHFPSVGKLVGDKKIPARYFGPTSISDNIFQYLNRLAEVAVVVEEYAEIIKNQTESIRDIAKTKPEVSPGDLEDYLHTLNTSLHSSDIKNLLKDLTRLDVELCDAARIYTDKAESVRDIIGEIEKDLDFVGRITWEISSELKQKSDKK